jgi:hypothetical protein
MPDVQSPQNATGHSPSPLLEPSKSVYADSPKLD